MQQMTKMLITCHIAVHWTLHYWLQLLTHPPATDIFIIDFYDLNGPVIITNPSLVTSLKNTVEEIYLQFKGIEVVYCNISNT